MTDAGLTVEGRPTARSAGYSATLQIVALTPFSGRGLTRTRLALRGLGDCPVDDSRACHYARAVIAREDYGSDLQDRYVQLVWDILVGGYECVKALGYCRGEEGSVLERLPTHLPCGTDIVIGQVVSEGRGSAVVEDNSHAFGAASGVG